ncbi:hypothetical protein [Cohnella soli]|uniref:Uncharacterized protein n=1 Tax=Cohnella soli TaxID=425005 RepID=A0ABW0I3X3_9BACL
MKALQITGSGQYAIVETELPELQDHQVLVEIKIVSTCPRCDMNMMAGRDRKTTMDGITEGWLQTTQLITHRFPVERVAESWELILDKSRPCLGVVLDWKEDR